VDCTAGVLSDRSKPLSVDVSENRRTSSGTQRRDSLLRYPEVDYTRPELINLVISDVGVLTPSGVSQYLVGMFAG